MSAQIVNHLKIKLRFCTKCNFRVRFPSKLSANFSAGHWICCIPIILAYDFKPTVNAGLPNWDKHCGLPVTTAVEMLNVAGIMKSTPG